MFSLVPMSLMKGASMLLGTWSVQVPSARASSLCAHSSSGPECDCMPFTPPSERMKEREPSVAR